MISKQSSRMCIEGEQPQQTSNKSYEQKKRDQEKGRVTTQVVAKNKSRVPQVFLGE